MRAGERRQYYRRTLRLCSTYPFFYCSNGCMNSPHGKMVRTFPILFSLRGRVGRSSFPGKRKSVTKYLKHWCSVELRLLAVGARSTSATTWKHSVSSLLRRLGCSGVIYCRESDVWLTVHRNSV